jgi:protein-disulfide isomerase
MRKLLTVFSSAVALTMASSAFAQENPLAKRQQQETPPVLKFFENQGVKLTYLGDDGGLPGYLGESPTGKMQTFYLTPDGKHVVAGVLFRDGGVNVTGVQIGEMQRRYAEAQKRIEDAKNALGQAQVAGIAANNPSDKAQVATRSSDVGSSVNLKADKKNPWTSRLDKETFLKDVAEVAWFSVGVENVPVLYLVADPQCPFCHAAWAKLRPMVIDRKLQVRVILYPGKGDSSIPLVLGILGRQDPGRAWLAGEGSVEGVKITDAPAKDSAEFKTASRYMQVNSKFAEQYQVSKTPFMAYVGRDGSLYSSMGLPQGNDMDEFLSNLN